MPRSNKRCKLLCDWKLCKTPSISTWAHGCRWEIEAIVNVVIKNQLNDKRYKCSIRPSIASYKYKLVVISLWQFFFSFPAKILLFYVIFYAALAGFFAAIFAVFYQTLDDQKPKWMLDNGLIGSNPGLGFRPMPEDSNVESTLIWFEASNERNTKYWIEALNDFTKSKFLEYFYFKIIFNVQLKN